MGLQIPLPFTAVSRFAEADFREAPSNDAACAWLRRPLEWPDHRLALWGSEGSGKTHLLHIWAERSGAALWSGANLALLPDMPAAGVALDDADISNEAALLHLLNAAREAQKPVLLAARTPPARWRVQLPDLASRLRAILAVPIGPPEDDLLRALVTRQLAERQLRPAGAVRDWLVLRLPRSPAVLREAVARLDAASLDQQRRITVRFAATVLADLLAADEISGKPPGPSPDDEPIL